MSRWLGRVVRRVRGSAACGAVRFTLKAKDEIAELGVPFDARECLSVLSRLQTRDFRARVWSEPTAEWLYVFGTRAHGELLYIKVALRQTCCVISFHAEEGEA